MEVETKSSVSKSVNAPKPENTKKLNLKSDKNNEFIIEFYAYENNLIFEGQAKNAIPQKNYKKIYSLDNVQKNNKYFLICENINEIYDEILSQISQNEEGVKLIEKLNAVILSIPLNTKKIKECTFEINEVTHNTNDKINELYSIVNQLTDEIKKLNEKNKALEEKVENIQKVLLQKDLNKIREWISPEKDITFNLLFKKSRDGNSTKDFHDHCDNKGKTLIIIETLEGRRFGGVTYDDWNTNDKWRKNTNDFVFSLDLNKKYIYNGTNYTTVGDLEYGFAFGNGRTDKVDICFQNNSLEDGISNSSSSFKTNKELNNGIENFKAKEIEVFQIIIN